MNERIFFYMFDQSLRRMPSVRFRIQQLAAELRGRAALKREGHPGVRQLPAGGAGGLLSFAGCGAPGGLCAPG